MDKSSKLSFSVKGTVHDGDLNPTNLTLPILSEFIEQITTFIRGGGNQNLEELKTSINEGSLAVDVINEQGMLNDAITDYAILSRTKSLNNINPQRAKIIEQWETLAKDNDAREYELRTTGEDGTTSTFRITSRTNLKKKTEIWVEVDLYVYGTIFDMGGKKKSNVHIELENGTTVKISAHAPILASVKDNKLYKDQLVRIKAEKNIETGELKNEQLISFEHFSPEYNEKDFEKISRKATKAWESIKSTTEWVENIRGSYG